MSRPVRLTDPLGIRTAQALGVADDTSPLPLVYGAVRLQPVRYDAGGRLWLVADHPIAGVDQVEKGGTVSGAWTWRHAVDATGRAVALVETLDTVASASGLAVTVRGAVHATSGAALDRPDLVVADLAARAGYALDAARLDDLRATCSTAGLQVGGVIAEAGITLQGALDQLAQGAGLAWSREAPGIAQLWPAEPAAPVATLTRRESPALSARWSARDLATVVELRYAYDWASGDYGASVTLRAPAAVERYGEILQRIEAPWLRDARAAIAHATRWLQHHARPIWEITVQAPRGFAAVGEAVALDHPYAPVTTAWVRTRSDAGPDSSLVLVAAAGDVPGVV